MPYDENSFLQGIAVGRSMKGVTVMSGGGDWDGKTKVYSATISPSANILSLGASTENYEAGAAQVYSLFIAPTGENIAKTETVPSAPAISGLTASAVITIDES